MHTALTVGELRPLPAQQRTSAIPFLTDSTYQFPESELTYSQTPNGVLVTYDGLLVAWIFRGHAGSRGNAGRVQFYDVAFPSLTFGQQQRVTGIMLDSTSFDSLADAVAFVEATFTSGQEVRS